MKNDADRPRSRRFDFKCIADLGRNARSHGHPQPEYQYHILPGEMDLGTDENGVNGRVWNSCEWF